MPVPVPISSQSEDMRESLIAQLMRDDPSLSREEAEELVDAVL